MVHVPGKENVVADVLSYQHGTDCKVTSIYPDLVRIVFVKHLQDRGTGEGFLQLLEGGFFFISPR